MGVFPKETHGIIVISVMVIYIFISVIMIVEIFSKVIDPKVIDNTYVSSSCRVAHKAPQDLARPLCLGLSLDKIDNSLLLFCYIYCSKLTKYQVCLHVIL